MKVLKRSVGYMSPLNVFFDINSIIIEFLTTFFFVTSTNCFIILKFYGIGFVKWAMKFESDSPV